MPAYGPGGMPLHRKQTLQERGHVFGPEPSPPIVTHIGPSRGLVAPNGSIYYYPLNRPGVGHMVYPIISPTPPRRVRA
jgi:hypothetical protein